MVIFSIQYHGEKIRFFIVILHMKKLTLKVVKRFPHVSIVCRSPVLEQFIS